MATNLPRVPEFLNLVGGLASLPELFLASAKWRGITREEVREVIRLIPQPILEVTGFLDRLTSLWRYDYGEPFVGLPGGSFVLGTNMFHEVDRLFDVLACARWRLESGALSNYLTRLADRKNHQNLLSEFAPILRLDSKTKVDYEVGGYGEGNTTVDWFIQSAGVSLLLDVKNRTRDLLESLARLQVGEREPDGTAPAPTHDPQLLFRSIESKFSPRDPSEIIQAVWIMTFIKQEERELIEAFGTLDPSRVHVAVLANWEEDAYVLAKDPAVKERVLGALKLRESRRFVFRRSAKP